MVKLNTKTEVALAAGDKLAVIDVSDTGVDANGAVKLVVATQRMVDLLALLATADTFVGGNGSNIVLRTAAQTRASLNVEDGATADQTGAEIKAAYEAEANAFTDAQFTKLAGIETGATADQTGAEIKAAYEAEADTNAFTDADHSKLDGIEAAADVTDTANVTAAGALMDSELTDLAGVKALDTTDILFADTADTLTKGFGTTAHNAGTKSSGTYTPDEASGNVQYATNGGAHTLAPMTNNGTVIIHYTNNGSAGAITTSGFTLVDGDSFTTTNTHEFLCFLTKANDVSVLTVKALQ